MQINALRQKNKSSSAAIGRDRGGSKVQREGRAIGEGDWVVEVYFQWVGHFPTPFT